jgi:subtilase family serine protease
MIRRMAMFLLACVALASAVNLCRADTQALLTRHTREVTLNGEAPMVGHLPADQSMRIVLVLPLRDQAGLQSFLKDVYDPANATYHKFLTVDQFTEKYGPAAADYESVQRWAKGNGFTVVATSRNRLNLDLIGSVAAIEKAFHVSMRVYQHPSETRTFYAPDREPTVDLPVQLWHVTGLDNYSIPKPALVKRGPNAPNVKSNATTGSCPSASFCGSDMRAAYYEGQVLTGAGQSLGLLEYAGTDLTDLDTYYTNAGQTNNVPITLLSTDGTSTSCVYDKAGGFCDDTEQTVDMTQALGMAPGMASLVMYVGSTDSAIFNAMATANPLNLQLSSSWGWSPPDPTTDDPYFEEFEAQGQSLFQAAGDGGAWTPETAVWPAEDQYLTAVGGTDLETQSAGGPWSSETVWEYGGGGIANGIAIPFYQVAAAAGCVALGVDPCSETLRNAPDVSANANFTFYVCADQEACTANEYGGTSFAAPMWAGYLALTNQQSVFNGLGPVGFINPKIYTIGLATTYSEDFHDIVSGSNGYSATIGYDLASGWGSPNGSGLIDGLGGKAYASFLLTAAPTSETAQQGTTVTPEIIATPTGDFNGTITLTASGQPAGVTITFSPDTIPAGSAALMTVAVGVTTTPGTYPITITGTSGSIVQTTTFTLTVIAEIPAIKVAVSPTAMGIEVGSSKTAKVTTTVSGGFDSAVTLSISGLGQNMSATFSPSTIPAPGAGTSALEIAVGSGALAKRYTLTITATGAGVSSTTYLDVVVEN